MGHPRPRSCLRATPTIVSPVLVTSELELAPPSHASPRRTPAPCGLGTWYIHSRRVLTSRSTDPKRIRRLTATHDAGSPSGVGCGGWRCRGAFRSCGSSFRLVWKSAGGCVGQRLTWREARQETAGTRRLGALGDRGWQGPACGGLLLCGGRGMPPWHTLA